MRLRQISEALSRRRFLQNTSAVLGGWKQAFKMLTSNPVSAFSNLAKLYGDMDGPSKYILNSFMSGFTNTMSSDKSEVGHLKGHIEPKDYLEEYSENGMIVSPALPHFFSKRDETSLTSIDFFGPDSPSFTPFDNSVPVPSVPIEAIMGKLAWLIDQDSYGAAQVLSGAAPENFELISPGIMSKALDYSIKKYGVEEFAGSLCKMNRKMRINDQVFNVWELALSNPELSKFMDMTPDMVRTAAKTGRGLAKMVDKGLLDKAEVGKWRDFLRDGGHEGRRKINQEKQEKWKKRGQQEREQAKLKKEREEQAKKEPEVYEPRSDDYIYGSPMHQPFESRLRIALARI